jgi:hypothetical protein
MTESKGGMTYEHVEQAPYGTVIKLQVMKVHVMSDMYL